MKRQDKLRILRERLRLATQRYDDLLELEYEMSGNKARREARQLTHPHDPIPRMIPPRPDCGELQNAGPIRQLRHACEYMERRGDDLAEKVGGLVVAS